MRIIVVNYFGILPDEPGATRHYEMASFFQNKNGTEVELWINNLNYHTDKKKRSAPKRGRFITSENGLKIEFFRGIRHRNKKVLREFGMLYFSLLTAARLMRTKADIVILSMPPVNNLLALVAKAKKIPLIADVEDLWPLFIEESGVKNKAVLKYYEVQANSVYKIASAIEAVSKGMLDYVSEVIDCSKKIKWISPLGVNIEAYDELKATDDLQKYKWRDDFKVMYVGAHGVANDIISVIDTIEEFNKIELTVGGKKVSFIFIGDGNYKKEIEEYARGKELDNVFFEKPISGDLVPFYLKSADVCLTNLRRLECFKLVRPNKLFQYMAAAKPIVCGIWGESEEIVEEAGAGINVDFTRPIDAANAIRQFLQGNLDSYGINGNTYIRKTGDRHIIFEDFYKKIIETIHERTFK